MTISRRTFLTTAAFATAAAPNIVTPAVLGRAGETAPSERITLGVIGTGSKGIDGMRQFLQHTDAQVLAVCDVDRRAREQAKRLLDEFYGNKDSIAYNDFRDLLARADIDAVLIASPDHWHVPMAIRAAEAGKHIFCEKPLSNTIDEGRHLVKAVEEAGVVFQHGTQLRSNPNVRRACELVRNGRIGNLERIVIGSPAGHALTEPQPTKPPPEWLDYDLWLGPAPYMPFTPRLLRVPGEFPGWYFISNFSRAGWVCGFAVHDIDIAHWAMGTERTGPVTIEGEGVFREGSLFDTATRYRVECTYANGIKVLITNTDVSPHGVRFEGDEGWIHTRRELRGAPPAMLRSELGPDDIRLYRSDMHERDFLEAIREGRDPITPAEVAHRSTSVGLLSGLAMQLGRPLTWDAEAERFLDDDEANDNLVTPMRAPWQVGNAPVLGSDAVEGI